MSPTHDRYVHHPTCPCRRGAAAGRWCDTCGEHGSHHSDRHLAFHPHETARPAATTAPDSGSSRPDLLRRLLRRRR